MRKEEKIIFWLLLGIFVFGVIAEVIKNFLCFIEIEVDSFSGICTSVVGIQATVSVVIFSMVTMFSSFLNKERYGIPVIRYFIKYRNKVLNHSNIFYFVMILLVVSSISLFFGWINIIFCSFVVSTILITYLAKESFLLYRVEDIDEEMFSFLKDNLHNKGLNLFEEYLRSECMHLDNGDYEGKKPDSRLDELWISEIAKHVSSLDSEDFREIHDSFTVMVNKYLNGKEETVQSYGIDIAFSIINCYSKEKNKESEVDSYGNVNDDIPVFYTKSSFRNWMLSLIQIVYSDNPDRVKVRTIVSLIVKLDTTASKYDRYSLSKNFLFLLIKNAGGNKHRLGVLSQMLHSFKSVLRCDNSMDRDKYAEYAIHSFLMAIECGYIQIVGNEFINHGNKWKPETNEEKLLFGITICYLYYMGYAAKEDEIDKLYERRIKKCDFIKILQENSEAIFDFFCYIDLSHDYLVEMKRYMKSYEILIPGTGPKTMIIDYVIDKGMILCKALATNPFMDEWLKIIVQNDWFHIYDMIVENQNTKNELLEIKWLGDNTENSINTIYSNLISAIEKLSYTAEIYSSKTITKENEDKLID